jgi:hypothetical protein
MDQRNKKAPAQKRPVPSDKPRDRSDEPRRDPFPGRQPREIPLSDPPGDVVGDPQGDMIGDPPVEEPRTR